LAGWQRARADLDNFRRRLGEQNNSERHRLKKEILSSLLPLADNFQAMTDHVPAEFERNAWTDGVRHVARQLDQLLADLGVTPIEALNKPFDPVRHDAVSSVKQPDAATGQVIEVIQPGYIFHGEVIRPAKVKVAA
jgi:molecular chaperone GrpE